MIRILLIATQLEKKMRKKKGFAEHQAFIYLKTFRCLPAYLDYLKIN